MHFANKSKKKENLAEPIIADSMLQSKTWDTELAPQPEVEPYTAQLSSLKETEFDEYCEFENQERRLSKLISFLVILAGVVNACYGMFAPFLPLEMEKKSYKPDSMGAIIGIYSFSNIIASFCAANAIKRFGRRGFLAFNLVFLAVTMLALGFLMNFDLSEPKFVFLALFFRVLQGIAVGFINTLRFSLMGFMLPLERQGSANSMCQVSIGTGMTLSPVLGGLLYREMGYACPFIFLAAILVTLALFVKSFIPIQADKTDITREEASFSAYSLQSKGRSSVFRDYKRLLKKNRILFCYVLMILTCIQFVYLEPILALRLKNHYGMNTFQNNSTFALIPLAYLFGSLVYMICMKTRLQKVKSQTIVLSSGLLLVPSTLMCGPSIFLPDSVEIMVAGLFLLGLFSAFFVLPIFPLLSDQMRKEFGDRKAQELLDASAGLLNVSISIGVMVAPIWAQWSEREVGYKLTNDICALGSLVVMFLYLSYGKAFQDIFKKQTGAAQTF